MSLRSYSLNLWHCGAKQSRVEILAQHPFTFYISLCKQQTFSVRGAWCPCTVFSGWSTAPPWPAWGRTLAAHTCLFKSRLAAWGKAPVLCLSAHDPGYSLLVSPRLLNHNHLLWIGITLHASPFALCSPSLPNLCFPKEMVHRGVPELFYLDPVRQLYLTGKWVQRASECCLF